MSISPRKLESMTMCNKPAGLRGRCLRLPGHPGTCSVADTKERREDRAAYRKLILAGLIN